MPTFKVKISLIVVVVRTILCSALRCSLLTDRHCTSNEQKSTLQPQKARSAPRSNNAQAQVRLVFRGRRGGGVAMLLQLSTDQVDLVRSFMHIVKTVTRPKPVCQTAEPMKH